jgi:hypothetical protein
MPLIVPTISSLQRATTCTASVVLEQIGDGPQTAAAKRGTLIGGVIASELRGWPMPDVGRHKLKINMAALRDFLGEGAIRCEAAMSLRPDGAVENLGENVGRAYQRPGCINGAADIVVIRPHALCIDVKSGSYPVPDAADNWQVGALSSMLAMILDGDVESVSGVVAKIGRDGEWDFGKPCTWSPAELAVIRKRLVETYLVRWRDAQRLHDAGFEEPERVQGPECFFCKARCEFNRNAQEKSEAA